MDIFRVSYSTSLASSLGFEWFTSLTAAQKAQRQFEKRKDHEDPVAEILKIELKTTKADVVALLNKFASHPDNG